MVLLRLAPGLALALVLAGCVTPAADPGELSTADDPWALPPFEMTGTDCYLAGFVAAYNQESGRPTHLAEVWELADIREEIGNPPKDSTGNPVTGPMMGNWHIGGRCASIDSTAGAEDEFVFGFVGEMVKPPAWDAGGADLHFLLSGFSFANGTVGDAMRASTTADVTHTSYVKVDWFVPKELPRSAAYVAFLDAEKGLYESWSTLGVYRELDARTIRLWWQVPTDGTRGHGAHHHDSGGGLTSFGEENPTEGSWHPVYWDLAVSGGTHRVTPPVDGVEMGSHNMFSFEHGPILGLPCTTVHYENDALALSPATVVRDVLLDLLWTH